MPEELLFLDEVLRPFLKVPLISSPMKKFLPGKTFECIVFSNIFCRKSFFDWLKHFVTSIRNYLICPTKKYPINYLYL